jgi:hypothetical protein
VRLARSCDYLEIWTDGYQKVSRASTLLASPMATGTDRGSRRFAFGQNLIQIGRVVAVLVACFGGWGYMKWVVCVGLSLVLAGGDSVVRSVVPIRDASAVLSVKINVIL